MENKTYQIKIESILGGQAPTTHFAAPDQFRASLGINPGLSNSLSATAQPAYTFAPSGLLRPSGWDDLSPTDSSTFAYPLWLTGARSTTTIFGYFTGGGPNSLYAFISTSDFTGLSDGGTLANGGGNGLSYYDNYIYIAKDTDIARYGPLDGTPSFTGTYWTGTLGKTALTNVKYPIHAFDKSSSIQLPNHYLHRHSDGKLYIADTVGNQGTIHYIQTTKTTVEGDTDNGSTYSKLQFGYGLNISCMESYGSDLAIALFEKSQEYPGSGNGARNQKTRAKVAFWDTTSQNFNKITWVEFPDSVITAMKNINGVLYVFSSRVIGQHGFRVSRFLGGYTFEEVYYSEFGASPWPGAVDGISNELFFGTFTEVPEESACIYSLGLNKKLSSGLFNIASNKVTSSGVMSLVVVGQAGTSNDRYREKIIAGVRKTGTDSHLATAPEASSLKGASTWWSQMYRIGQPFKIKKVRFPLGIAVASNMTIVPKIYTDDGAGTTYTLATINSTNDNGLFNAVRRSGSAGEVITGQHNFWIELVWSGTALCTVGLPITIEYELTDD